MHLRQLSRRLPVVIPLLLAAAVVAAPGRAKAAEPGVWQTGDWSGGILHEAATGRIKGCYTSRAGAGQSMVMLSWSRDGLAVTLFDPRWSLSPGSAGTLDLAVDRRWSGTADGPALTAKARRAAIADGEAALKALRRGNTLIIRAEGGSHSFPLGGSSKAIAAMLDCHEANR